MQLPRPRGPVSDALVGALAAAPGSDLRIDVPPSIDPLADDDLQLALWICYELHYQGFDEVDPQWEWDPSLLGLRAVLERRVLDDLRRTVAVPAASTSVADALRDLVEGDAGPGLARYMQRRASRREFAEFVIHRSIYQLKEADPHTWAIPRLTGRAKAALVEIQTDEYGEGDATRMHSQLYRQLLQGLGLDDRYGAYVDCVPGITLALSNVMSLFGLHRELRGALVGHLAAYEMTSSAPCRRYAQGLRRLGGTEASCAFFDVHITADALHEQVAMHDLAGGLAEAEPQLADDILFGAAACLHVENRFGQHVLDSWAEERSSLWPAIPAESALPAEVATQSA